MIYWLAMVIGDGTANIQPLVELVIQYVVQMVHILVA
jgi:hypothetical protein